MGASRNTKFLLGILYLSYCVYGNFLALSQVVALRANIICNKIPGLAPKQRAICSRRPDAIVTIGEGVQVGMKECQYQFRNMRWNCSNMGAENTMFGNTHLIPSREAAFSYAVISAGATYSVTQACSLGKLNGCACDPKKKNGEYHSRGWTWGGCSADIRHGLKFSKKFLDAREFVETERSLMNLHNNRAGRKAVKELMENECKCHGVSGSCSMKTCWTTLPPFRRIGNQLFKKWNKSKTVKPIYEKRNRIPVFLTLKRSKRPHAKPKRRDLVHLAKSPNYCSHDPRTGSLGTVGRKCNRTSSGTDGCDLMCCGRGYNTHQYTKTEKCNCKFYWCCYVSCGKCSQKTEEYACK